MPCETCRSLREGLPLYLVAVGAVLTLVSFAVVFQSAGDEPYHTFYWRDAVTQVFLGMTLLTFWIEYLVVLIAAIVQRIVDAWWWLLVAWVALVMLYLHLCPFGYISDLTRFVQCELG